MSNLDKKKPLFGIDISSLDDEGLGKVVRAGFSDRGRGISLATVAAQIMVNQTYEINGDCTKMTLIGYCKGKKDEPGYIDMGDWQIKVCRLNKRKKFGLWLGSVWDWLCEIGMKKVPLSEFLKPNSKIKITRLETVDEDPFRKKGI